MGDSIAGVPLSMAHAFIAASSHRNEGNGLRFHRPNRVRRLRAWFAAMRQLEPLCASRTEKASAASRYGSSVIYRQRIFFCNGEIVCRGLRRRRQDEAFEAAS
jgi:hypothetical protein